MKAPRGRKVVAARRAADEELGKGDERRRAVVLRLRESVRGADLAIDRRDIILLETNDEDRRVRLGV